MIEILSIIEILLSLWHDRDTIDNRDTIDDIHTIDNRDTIKPMA
jgi:hypothetical protein